MIHSFAITNYLGDRIKLDLREPEVSGFLIKSVTGLGPVKATVNTTEVVTNDGSMFNSARLSQRNIVFQIVFVDTVYGETIEDVRQKSYKYFPAKKNVEIIIETDNRYVRTNGYVESNEPNIFSSQEGTSISIICPDPFFYSAGEDGNNVTDFYSIDPLLEFPFSNESLTEPLLVFGEIQIKTEGVITYYGDAEIGVTIYIHAIGPANNINIYNTETREVMKIDTGKLQKLTGKGIVASDDIVINTSKGDKSITLIREGVSYNILNCLDIYGGRVLIDLTGDTVDPSKLLKGSKAHDKSGAQIEGACTFDVDSTDATAVAAEILFGKTAYVSGNKLTGTMKNNGAVTKKITTRDEEVTIPQGFHDGSGKVGIDATEKGKLIANNIREGVTILGVEGTMSGSENMKPQAKTVTPSTAKQTILPDTEYNCLSQVEVEAIPYVEADNPAGGVTVTIAG